MLNGLDLFSGIGGISLALRPWVKPIAYCENDRYAQCVLLSRMASGELPEAPIWDDVRTLTMGVLGNAGASVDIISGGFPCQDISVAGAGAGLGGDRSGLVEEIFRLSSELRPNFIFMENVPAITFRGLGSIVSRLASMGYDCRWTVLSAGEIGAVHLRERWWILAHANRDGRKTRDQGHARRLSIMPSFSPKRRTTWAPNGDLTPRVDRIGNGLPARVDRGHALGNAVCPQAAREAFKRLMGLT